MKELKYCIQCKASSGSVGTFAYSDKDTAGTFIPTSPIFNGLIEFYAWAKAEGWRDNETHQLCNLYMVK